MRALLVASCAVVIASGCMVDFPPPVDEHADAGMGGSSGASGGLGGQSGGGGQSGSGGQGGGSGALAGGAGSAGSGGSSGAAGAAGAEPTGLIGYWPFDDDTASNVVVDKVGNPPRNGSFVAGNISWASDAMFETVLAFNEGAGVTMPGWSGASFPAVGTISVWVKFNLVAADEGTNRGVFDNWDSTRDHVFIRRSNLDTGFPLTLQAGFYSGTSGWIKSGQNSQIPNKTWKHVAIGWDTTLDKGLLYAGDNVGPGNITNADLSSEPSWIPKQQNFVFGDKLIGWLAEARLYDRMLSYSELEQIGKLPTGPR